MKAEAPGRIGPVLVLIDDAQDLARAITQRPDALVADAAILREVGMADLSTPLWARIRIPFDGRSDPDLDAALAAGATGLLASGIASVADLERLGTRLAVREAERGLPDGQVRILAGFGDSPAGILATERLGRDRPPRLAGLVCDPGQLAEALGCHLSSPVVAAAEARLVLAAGAIRVPAVTMLAADGDPAKAARAARRSGYAAVILRDASALPVIRRAFGI